MQARVNTEKYPYKVLNKADFLSLPFLVRINAKFTEIESARAEFGDLAILIGENWYFYGTIHPKWGYFALGTRYYFRDEADAVWFKLRYG